MRIDPRTGSGTNWRVSLQGVDVSTLCVAVDDEEDWAEILVTAPNPQKPGDWVVFMGDNGNPVTVVVYGEVRITAI